MLRDYIWSLLAVALFLGTYTALMLTFSTHKAPEKAMETARASISIHAGSEENSSSSTAAAMKLSD